MKMLKFAVGSTDQDKWEFYCKCICCLSTSEVKTFNAELLKLSM
jgi:hypothetical protein